jgi:uncharacterized protein YecE (DUF72 family)
MEVRLGTSGWQYKHWRERFYPAGVPQRAWLPFYAERFDTVELNNSFYRLPERDQFERWAEAVPDAFEFAVKASRYLTHIRLLTEPEDPVRRLMDAAEGLGEHLGPILVQLPPRLQFEPDRLAATLRAFPRQMRVAVEFRHKTWFVDETRTILEKHAAALCLADRRGPISPVWATTDWTYLRFHAGRGRPRGGYGDQALEGWAERLAGLEIDSAYVYFNNDWLGLALRDAVTFARFAARRGFDVSRTPDARSIEAG